MPMPVCRARAWLRMPPLISGWEAAQADAVAGVTKKFMYPQQTDADGPARQQGQRHSDAFAPGHRLARLLP